MGHEYDAMRNMEARMAKQEEHTMQCSADVQRLKEIVEANNVSLQEFIELSKAFKFGITLLGWIERFAAWVTKLALAGGTLWAVWKYLVKEAVARVAR